MDRDRRAGGEMDFHVLSLSGTWSKLGFLTAVPGGWEAVTVCVAALVPARAFASFFCSSDLRQGTIF